MGLAITNLKTTVLECDGMNPCWIAWDGMEWNRMGWDMMGWDGIDGTVHGDRGVGQACKRGTDVDWMATWHGCRWDGQAWQRGTDVDGMSTWHGRRWNGVDGMGCDCNVARNSMKMCQTYL